MKIFANVQTYNFCLLRYTFALLKQRFLIEFNYFIFSKFTMNFFHEEGVIIRSINGKEVAACERREKRGHGDAQCDPLGQLWEEDLSSS